MDFEEKRNQYLLHLEEKLKNSFHLDFNVMENHDHYDLKASYQDVRGRVFITPQDVIDGMVLRETIYIRTLRLPTQKDVADFFQRIRKIGEDLVPCKDHFQTDLTGILIAERLPRGIAASLKKMRYQRIYCLYFRGWCQVRLLLAELSTDKLFCNPAARPLKKTFAPKQYYPGLERSDRF